MGINHYICVSIKHKIELSLMANHVCTLVVGLIHTSSQQRGLANDLDFKDRKFDLLRYSMLLLAELANKSDRVTGVSMHS